MQYTKPTSERYGSGSLKTIQNQEERELRFSRVAVRKDSQFEMSFELGSKELLRFKRIKRESLILAQDERWRRA